MSKGNSPTIVSCPTCGQPVEWTPANTWRPFCSERCRLIDLGAWFEEEHRIPGEPGQPPQERDD
ncbi:MAG: DNA gyrase inhibitor YacG [Gammaproteobacteria bacterium]